MKLLCYDFQCRLCDFFQQEYNIRYIFAGRAYGNLGLSQESLGEYDKAIVLQEQHLSIAAQIGDKSAKILAYSSLGKSLNSVLSWQVV